MSPAFPQRIRPGLARVRRALDLLGHPEESFASVVVAGTNGKGSVSAMMESVLRRAGYRTGLYTSPHLVNVRERVTLSGGRVGSSRWRWATERVGDLNRSARLGLTSFEAQTLAAFLVFEKARVDIAVLEVGLGGRWDAVNSVSAPELSVITSIGLDHTEWLGPTVDHIYREKRGVARSGTLLVQNIPTRLRPQSARWAAAQGVPTWTFRREVQLTAVRRFSPERGQLITVQVPGGVKISARVPFWGEHQARNGALAVAGLVQLCRRGWNVSDRAIQEGVAHAHWPGRFQVVR
ncbi:MAG: bifunctional folylpolyglutamate synthase/dihydrofolate synthase, partial [Elusimicrobia bacterium]|nr:bifunctional folylpolyglutamate synthase/dihydrofolate synthase [Elusimicrobiota bacterium]